MIIDWSDRGYMPTIVAVGDEDPFIIEFQVDGYLKKVVYLEKGVLYTWDILKELGAYPFEDE